MSVLVNGMEMPTCCFKCGFHHRSVDDFEYCGANNQEFNDGYDNTKPLINPYKEKLSNCPLVLVPSHGKLIDADRLADSFEPSDFWNSDAEDNCFAAIHIVHSAPTIIEAEPLKEET